MTATLDARVAQTLSTLTPAERASAEGQLARRLARRQALHRYRTPTELARGLGGPGVAVTPMTRMLDSVLVAADAGWRTRWVVNTPPQESKTTTINQWGALWLLLRDPTRAIVVASYEQGIAARSGLAVRQFIETYGGGYRGQRRDSDQVDQLGLVLDPDRSQQTAWALSVEGYGQQGSMQSVGIGSALTGRRANVLIVDDPLKDAAQADSPVYRERAKEWYKAVATTRLSGQTIVIVVQCLTGDTPVLMADGTERPLRNVRPGDEVATYEHGALTTATVRHAANQGPDTTYRVRMISGTEVRGNERHPFLVRQEDGSETWRRLGDLRPGDAIVRATRPGEASSESSAPTAAASPRSARAAACPATTGTAGPADTGRPAPTPSPDGPPTSSTGTASPPRSTTGASPNKTAGAPSADASPRTPASPTTGATSWPSTTTTTPGTSEDCSATTATSSSPEATPPRSSASPPTTSSVTTDRVAEVVLDGYEDVYDLEIDRTENFIAAGLCVHNTRWHEDDLSGWLIREDNKRLTPRWSRLIIPAQAEADDPLGREPGQWLQSVQGRTPAEWEERKDEVGERVWFALYQQRPSPPGGGVFQRAWFERFRTAPWPDMAHTVVWVDPADNSGTGDEAGIVAGGLGSDGNLYLLEDASGAMTVGRWLRVAFLLALKWGASRVRYEQSLSQLRERAEREWRRLRRQARVLSAYQRAAVRDEGRDPDRDPWPREPVGEVLRLAVEYLALDDDTEPMKRELEAELRELWRHVPKVMELPPTGVPVSGEKAKGTKTHRAVLVAPLVQNGSVRLVGHHATLEHQCATWMEHQDSPDRMDAFVHWCSDLARHIGTVTVQGAGDAGVTPLPTRLHQATRTGARPSRRPGSPGRSGAWDAPGIDRSTR